MRRVLTLAVWLLLAACVQAANRYYTQRLERMAQALRLPTDSLPAEAYANGRQLRVKTNAYGDISNIGYRLFGDEAMGQQRYLPVLDFIERYLLELDMRLDGLSPQERMDIDRVVISKGSLRQLRSIDASADFSIAELRRRMYKVTWRTKGGDVEMAFPADCQLLIGANAVELEEMMKRDLRRIMPIDAAAVITDWDNAKVTRSKGSVVIEGGTYLSDQIRGDIYLTEHGGKRQLVCTPRNTRASIINIMLTGQFANSLPLRLRLDKYGYRTDELDITLQQFVAYCKSEGCKLYFGIKTNDGKTLTGTLFAYNEPLAYNHVLSVCIPLSILDGRSETISATAYAYIPLQNVTERFFTHDIQQEIRK